MTLHPHLFSITGRFCFQDLIPIISRKGDNKMARGIRKTPVEKLKEELYEVEESINRYNGILSDLKTKKKEIQENIKIEELKELSQILEEKQISVEDMKAMIEATKK